MQAPGNCNDLDAAQLQRWTQRLSAGFAAEVEGTRSVPQPPYRRAWFFDAAAQGLDGTQAADIRWTAYPKKAKQANWALIDQQRNAQEEYCEWEVARRDGKVIRVTFTTETEDYYRFLWHHATDRLLDLYHRFVAPEVKLEELGKDGEYDPHNGWNWPGPRRGALMHMGQVNNTLQAAMNLTARATWPLVDVAGTPITSEQELIRALRFGDPARHSDPHIGAQVNELVRAGHEVSFADPVGLYIHEVDLADFELPDGGNPGTLMRQTRGEPGHALRIVFEAPAGASYLLEDVTVGGRKIRFGSQIAEKVQVRVRGAARRASESAPRLRYPGFGVVGEAVLDGPQPMADIVATKDAPQRPAGSSRLASVDSLVSPE
jgi:hypothetical protein